MDGDEAAAEAVLRGEGPGEAAWRAAAAIPDGAWRNAKRMQGAQIAVCDYIMPASRKGRDFFELFEGEMPLGPLCDCLSYQLDLPLARKQELLEEPDVAVRARVLIATVKQMLGDTADPPRKFPPDFSLN